MENSCCLLYLIEYKLGFLKSTVDRLMYVIKRGRSYLMLNAVDLRMTLMLHTRFAQLKTYEKM